ncbi:hypothetical protein Tco_0066174 [Tanacetum coccineum]
MSVRFIRPIEEQDTLQNSIGLPRATWPAGITPEYVRIHAQQSQPEAIMPLSGSQPLPSQKEKQMEDQEQMED